MKDIDREQRKLTFVNKGGATHTAFLAPEILNAIDRYIKEDRAEAKPEDPLFLSERGNRISVDAIEHLCKKCGKMIGKNGTPHAMRRTCLTRVKEIEGMEMAQMFGAHSDAKMTKRYIYDTVEEMDKVYGRMGLFSEGSTVESKK
jgi:integrase